MSSNQTLTLLIPCFNEELRIPETLEFLTKWKESNQNINTEIMIVNDGSTDQTEKIIKESPLEVNIVNLPKNLGKGGAICEGVKAVTTDLVLIMDADLSTPLKHVNDFFDHISSTNVDIVVANRFDKKSKITNSAIRKLSSRIFYFIVHALKRFETQDTQCGFKLFKTDIAKDLFSNLNLYGYSFDLEILYKAEKSYKISQLPISWVQKDGSRVSIFRDGLRMIVDLLKLK